MDFKGVLYIFSIILMNLTFTKSQHTETEVNNDTKTYENNLRKIFSTVKYTESKLITNLDDIPLEDEEYFDRVLHEKYKNSNVTILKAFKSKMQNRNLKSIQNIDQNNLACGVRNFPDIKDKISNGRSTNEFEFPWMVAILMNNSIDKQEFIASGSLIHPRLVLTAAHTLDIYLSFSSANQKTLIPESKILDKYKGKLFVRSGDHDLSDNNESKMHQVSLVDEIMLHPHYNGFISLTNNDIAILHLEDDFQFDINVKTICLPPENTNFNGKNCLTTGWGKNGRKFGEYQIVLQVIETPVIEINECKKIIEKKEGKNSLPTNDNMICAGGELNKNPCKGDFGSPLFCPIEKSVNQYYQAGIVSNAPNCNSSIPTFYTNVASFTSWIKFIVKVTYDLKIDSYTYFQDDIEEDLIPDYEGEKP